jgi:hypothetical protein
MVSSQGLSDFCNWCFAFVVLECGVRCESQLHRAEEVRSAGMLQEDVTNPNFKNVS